MGLAIRAENTPSTAPASRPENVPVRNLTK